MQQDTSPSLLPPPTVHHHVCSLSRPTTPLGAAGPRPLHRGATASSAGSAVALCPLQVCAGEGAAGNAASHTGQVFQGRYTLSAVEKCFQATGIYTGRFIKGRVRWEYGRAVILARHQLCGLASVSDVPGPSLATPILLGPAGGVAGSCHTSKGRPSARKCWASRHSWAWRFGWTGQPQEPRECVCIYCVVTIFNPQRMREGYSSQSCLSVCVSVPSTLEPAANASTSVSTMSRRYSPVFVLRLYSDQSFRKKAQFVYTTTGHFNEPRPYFSCTPIIAPWVLQSEVPALPRRSKLPFQVWSIPS